MMRLLVLALIALAVLWFGRDFYRDTGAGPAADAAYGAADRAAAGSPETVPDTAADETADGSSAADDPEQDTALLASAFSLNGYELTPRADFRITARVLGRKEYSSGRESELSPLDLALGWGPMSDDAVLDRISISQSNRFFFWRTPEFPIPRREIERHASNMHMIPADETVADRLDDVDVGDVVTLKGKLVDVRADDGWKWRTSLTRDDTGKGACELFYVEFVITQ